MYQLCSEQGDGVDRAETDLLINLSTLTQRGLAKMIGCHESKISRTDWRFIASVL
ncbi:CII family transcriptional regulator, partial [Escherichia coli]